MTLQQVIWLTIGIIVSAWMLTGIAYLFTKMIRQSSHYINESLGKVTVSKRHKVVKFVGGGAYEGEIRINLNQYLEVSSFIIKNEEGFTGISYNNRYEKEFGVSVHRSGWIRIGCQRMTRNQFFAMDKFIKDKFNI